MPGRRLGILLLLVAVLSMHGVQYMSAGAHGPAAVTADQTLDAAAVAALVPAPLVLADDVGMMTAPAASAVGSDTVPGHGIPAHAWSLCLAVLLAGLAWLGAALARRTAGVSARQPASRSRGTVLRSRPPRPPALSVLCLLRI